MGTPSISTNEITPGSDEMPDFLSPQFFIGEIRIGSVSNASAVNIGNNWPTDFKSYHKQNQGFGSVGGNKNHFSNARAYLYDPDEFDMVNAAESSVPDWVKEMTAKKRLEENNESHGD
jgi:hypothetical protein